MLTNKEIVCPNNLLDVALKKKNVKVLMLDTGYKLEKYIFPFKRVSRRSEVRPVIEALDYKFERK